MSSKGSPTNFGDCVIHRLDNILKSKEHSDILFKLKYKKTEKKIHGHKLLFKIGSPVFKILLSEEWADKEEVELVDDEPLAFGIMTRYLYTDVIELYTYETAAAVFKLADKYAVEHLKYQCLNYLLSVTVPANVCYILEFSELYDQVGLYEHCIDIIAKKTRSVVSTNDFMCCSERALRIIVIQRELAITELELFKSIQSWAYYNSKKYGDPIENYATSLAEVVNNIRFLTMKPVEFVDGPGKSFLLSTEEQLNLLKNIIKPGIQPLFERFCTSTEYRRGSV